MKEKIQAHLAEVNAYTPGSPEEIENFRIRYLGRKGVLTDLFEEFKTIPGPQKKETGQLLNELKTTLQEKYNAWVQESQNSINADAPIRDYTMPADFLPQGTRHPLAVVRSEIIRIFNAIGYVISEGPEIEDDWHNFSALNFPEDHPARDMQDTFFISDTLALRTHTSSVQVRVMEKENPPIRTISPGRVYRNEAISARAHCFFHQVEGLYIDENVSFADLKQTLLYFAREMFGAETKIRLRPSYFPFTEPSAEMDISCFICNGKGCNICKQSGWVEILGCGMVDPKVLENCKIDSVKYAGFAFGMGIERIAMLKYKVNDLRLFPENDLRFLKQFEAEW